MSERLAARKEFGERIADISRYDFVQRHVYGSLPEVGGTALRPDEFEVSIVQNDGTGPATIEYRLRNSTRLFAKLYRDESGLHAYHVLRSLYKEEFGGDQRYRVAEPLCFVGEKNFLLTRLAEGTCLTSHISQDTSHAVEGVREAATWLAKLHGSPIRIGKVDDPWYIFSKLCSRMSKATASHPQELKSLTSQLDEVEELAKGLESRDLVQTHGQFRPVHVFLTDETVTVVDLDRSRPSDPAKDLAEFIHRMRSTIFHKYGVMDQADRLTEAFLDEYSAQRPSGVKNLAFYHCFHILVSQCHKIKALSSSDYEWRNANDFYSNEFDDALSGRFLS